MKLSGLDAHGFQSDKLSQPWSEGIAKIKENPTLIVLFLIIVNLAITVPLAAILNIWIDEAYTLDTSGQGMGYAISQSIHFEEQAPLYFMLLTLWRSLSSSILFARLFSVLCIALTIYIATLISRRLFKDLHPGWIAAAIALNPVAIWAAVEIRLYALSILLSSLIVLLFLDGYLNQKPSKGVRVLYILLGAAALYTHYFLGFILFANAIVLLCLGRIKTFRRYCLDVAVSGFLFLPFILILVRQFLYLSDNYVVNSSDPSTPFINSLKLSFGGIPKYLLPDVRGPLAMAWKLLRVFLLSMLFLITFKQRRHINQNSIIIWLITVVTAAVFFVMFELVDRIYFRHTSLMLVPAQVSMFAVFSLIRGVSRKKILSIWLVATLLLHLGALTITYSPLAKSGDYARVASYIEANESPNQGVLVFDPQVAMAFEHYYQGVNKLVILPKAEDFKVYDYSEFLLESEKEITTALAQMPETPRDLWLVTYTEFQEGMLSIYQNSYQILETFVDGSYTVEADQDFYGSNVKLLHQVKPDAR